MTDEPTSSNEPESGHPPTETMRTPRGQTYRKCAACGMYVPAHMEVCPECGAYEDEPEAPLAEEAPNAILSSAVVGVLLVALLVISLAPRPETSNASAGEDGVTSPEPRIENPEPEPRPEPDPRPKPDPEPEPEPRPQPEPQPEPEPTPFNPIVPTPTPTPAPPPPTPTPAPRSPTLELKDQLIQEYGAQLDESHPFAEEGQFIRLTLRDGRTPSGTIVRLERQQLLLETETGRVWIVFRQLAPESRIRVDRGERNAHIEEKALQEVLRRLQE